MDKIRNKPRLLTIPEASQLIHGLTEYRLRKLCKSGEIKNFKFDNRIMVLEQDVLNYFNIHNNIENQK